jgi:cobalt-zinc-cadmium efflux system membrane fusion protein
VRISIDNHTGTLLPNMFGTVSFSGPKASAAAGLSVPQSALLMNNDTITVLVEVRPWTFERRVVKLGDEDDNSAQVLSGVSQGERVVVRGGVLLND